MPWQRNARLVAVLVAVGVTLAVALAYKRQPAPGGGAVPVPADPTALVESANGQRIRLNREKEEVRIQYDTLVSYANGPTKMQGVKVTTVRAGDRTFVVTGKQAELGQNETNITLEGDVRLQTCGPSRARQRSSAAGTVDEPPEECLDGMMARTERATYTEADAMVRAPGPIEFSRGRLTGTGLGLTYAKNVDVLTILERAVVHMSPNPAGVGALDIAAGSAEFSRPDHVIRFSGGVKVIRGGQTIDADSAVARLSADEQQVEAVELRGRASLTAADPGVGGLSAMRGQSIDLKYRADGETLERALVTGDAAAHVGGDRSQDRVIVAGTLDVSLAPDGSTPTGLTARDNVQLTIPAEKGSPARSIQAPALDGQGEPGRGLTQARFTGGVRFHERGPEVDRSAESGTLDVTLAPGFSEIEDARFAQNVRFEAGDLRAAAALARYVLGKGTLELTGSEPALTSPQVVNDRISVYGRRIDVTLSGPAVLAAGSVKSELKPPKKEASKEADTRMPAMFKADQLVAATADKLLYDGPASRAAYSGNAQLWQGDTSIRADTIVLNEKSGDLTARGSVATTFALSQDGKDGRKERVSSNATSDDFQYEEASRRATYLGAAHVNGPQGDMTASRVELFLKESGDELDRAEAYEAVTLRDQDRETRGSRLTYFAADERYVVSGAPVVIKDECGSETTGKRLTFDKRTDTIVVDGSEQTRTRTRGGTNCR